jgi:hypothetical protein
MAKTFLWKIVLGVHVNAFGANAPAASDWDEMIEQFVIRRGEIRGLLVHSEGGAPNAVQRKRIRESIPDMPKAALLTQSVMARAAMTAINLFTKSFDAFAPTDIDKALTYIKAPTEDWPALKKALEELKREFAQQR